MIVITLLVLLMCVKRTLCVTSFLSFLFEELKKNVYLFMLYDKFYYLRTR